MSTNDRRLFDETGEVITKDELNLAEYPFAMLSDRAPKGLKTLIFRDVIKQPNGNVVERRWTVTGSDAYGLPTASDEPVYLALMQVAREQGFSQPDIEFTCYDLLKRLGMPDGGLSYQRLRRSLLRLAGVLIVADSAFYDIKKGTYKTLSFGIIDEFELNGGQGSRERSYARFNRKLFSSIQAGALNTIDFKAYLSLNGSVSRRLYRYLDKAAYDGKSMYSIGLCKLAFERLGMPRHYAPSKIKRFLEPAHEELKSIGFLASAEFRKGREDTVVVYRFAQDEQGTADLVDRLVRGGITAAAARRLVGVFPRDRIERHLEAFQRMVRSGRVKPKNPAGWLRTAIEEDYVYETIEEAATPMLPNFEIPSAKRSLSDEELNQLRSVVGEERYVQIERAVREEVAMSPLFRDKMEGRAAQMRIRARIEEELLAASAASSLLEANDSGMA